MNQKDSNVYSNEVIDESTHDPIGVEKLISKYVNYKYIIPSGLDDVLKYINQTYNYLK